MGPAVDHPNAAGSPAPEADPGTSAAEAHLRLVPAALAMPQSQFPSRASFARCARRRGGL